jgi:hypothetical protein
VRAQLYVSEQHVVGVEIEVALVEVSEEVLFVRLGERLDGVPRRRVRSTTRVPEPDDVE